MVTVNGGQNDTTVDFGYYIEPGVLGQLGLGRPERQRHPGRRRAGHPRRAGAADDHLPQRRRHDALHARPTATGYYSSATCCWTRITTARGARRADLRHLRPERRPRAMRPARWIRARMTRPDSDNHAGVTATVAEGAVNNTYDFGFVRTASIGNYVWLDENGDGIQDAGEAGIPNVTVQLWNAAHTNVIATTYTDANGGYLFANVPPGAYQVDVLNSSCRPGLVQSTPTYRRSDFTNKADPYTVTVASGDENLTADFGYNWAPTADVTGNTGTGAIGDRVWVDVDGDGQQDPEEIGLAGVTVELCTTRRRATGSSAPPTTCWQADHHRRQRQLHLRRPCRRTPTWCASTAAHARGLHPDRRPGPLRHDRHQRQPRPPRPIVLGPGDVFVNADFGYQPQPAPAAPSATRSGSTPTQTACRMPASTASPGVTVALIRTATATALGRGRADHRHRHHRRQRPLRLHRPARHGRRRHRRLPRVGQRHRQRPGRSRMDLRSGRRRPAKSGHRDRQGHHRRH